MTRLGFRLVRQGGAANRGENYLGIVGAGEQDFIGSRSKIKDEMVPAAFFDDEPGKGRKSMGFRS